MSNLKTVLVVGTGTIGEPLIGLLARLKDDIGLDKVLFHKRTPLDYEVAKVNSLVDQGAALVVNEMRVDEFKALGHDVSYTLQQALELANVIIDCTPEGNKKAGEFVEHLRAAKRRGDKIRNAAAQQEWENRPIQVTVDKKEDS